MEWPFLNRGINVWDPWREVRQLKEEMDRVLHRYEPERSVMAPEFPAVDIWSNDEQAIVMAEIPGMTPDKIDISVQDDQMTIRGSRGSHECVEGEVFHRRERGFGEFIRTIGLPFSVNAENVEADYKNGVLQVKLPRAEHDKPKQITVKTG